jgi:5-hydroxyisourate hydrolase
MGKLTTHVLDTYHGRPAAGVAVELWRVAGDSRLYVLDIKTNADGRTDIPLLTDASLQAGEYELVFDVRGYFAAVMGREDASPFLGRVPIRFTVFDAAQHYHVPLLVSPWSYSTYRGS